VTIPRWIMGRLLEKDSPVFSFLGGPHCRSSFSLSLRCGRRQVAGGRRRLKAYFGMGAVAEGLVRRLAAAAQADFVAAAQAEGVAVGVADFEIAFDANGSVIHDADFGWHIYSKVALPGNLEPARTARAYNEGHGMIRLFL